MKKILIIICHYNRSSFSTALADEYIKGALDAQNDIKTLYLYDLNFNPMINSDNFSQLEPDLIEAQRLIKWADHIVFSYPTWWASPPAILKSFFERTFIPGFAYDYKTIDETPILMKNIMVSWNKYLKDKTARLLVTMDSPPWFYKLIIGDPGYKIMKDILEFCGFKKVYKTYYGSVKMSNNRKREKWLRGAYKTGLTD